MYNVLIADDERYICEGIAAFLDWQEYGFHIIGLAGNGEEALSMLSWQRCELVITDIRMPGLDGFALIEALQKKNPGVRIIVVSGFGDFAYAKQALQMGVKDFLLKPIDREELLDSVQKIKAGLDAELADYRRQLENNRIILRKLFLDLFSPEIPLHIACRRLRGQGIHLEGSCFTAAILREDGQNTDALEQGLLSYSIQNIAQELLEINGLFGYAFDDGAGTNGILFCGDASLRQTVPEFLQKLLSCMETYLHIRMEASVGTLAESVEKIRESYQAALESWRKPESRETRPRLSGDRPSEDFGLEWRSEGMLNALQLLEPEKSRKEIKRLLTEIREKRLPERLVRGILHGILFELMGLYQKYSISYDLDRFDQRLRTLEEENWEPSCAETFLISMEEEALRLFRETSMRPSNLILQIQQYCELHYSQSLTLQSIAGKFYMNPAYLGRLFHAETGSSFNDYLNCLRITAAKRQVAAGATKIVIEDLGYNNDEYFYRQFRKYEGRTFSEYRREVQSRKDFLLPEA